MSFSLRILLIICSLSLTIICYKKVKQSQMKSVEAVNWIINISADIGKVQHQELWHYEQALAEIRELLEIPQVQKTGKWIECDSSEHWKCSECGYRASYWFNEENSSSYDLDMSEWLSDYCPNCGARMVGEENR